MTKVSVIILAAGKGTRMKLGYNKLFYKLRKPILSHTIKAFEKHTSIDQIILVIDKNEIKMVKNLIKKEGFTKINQIICGGKTRQDSAYNGIMATKNSDIIMIHDGARPFINSDLISKIIIDTKKYGISVAGVPAKDTIKLANKNGFVNKTLERSKLWIIQTPQSFNTDLAKKVFQKAKEKNIIGTDDVSLAEALGYKVKMTLGHYDNIKITTPDDLLMAEKILEKK